MIILRKILEKLLKIENKSIISASISTDYTTTSNGYENLPLDKQLLKKGSKLTLHQDGYILVGEGISHVFVSGSVTYRNAVVNGGRQAISISRNSTNEIFTLNRMTGSYQSVVTQRKPISVSAGDKIYLRVRSQDSSTGGAIVACDNDGLYTMITVEEI